MSVVYIQWVWINLPREVTAEVPVCSPAVHTLKYFFPPVFNQPRRGIISRSKGVLSPPLIGPDGIRPSDTKSNRISLLRSLRRTPFAHNMRKMSTPLPPLSLLSRTLAWNTLISPPDPFPLLSPLKAITGDGCWLHSIRIKFFPFFDIPDRIARHALCNF